MSADSTPRHLVLLLDGPLQSWGFASRFQRRATGLHPTKSAVVGLVCAAMGLAKGSPEERDTLPELARLRMTSIALPRSGSHSQAKRLLVRRLVDFHTVLGTRKADGSMNKDAVMTHREYLLDARFGVMLQGASPLLERATQALMNPVWGLWLGRKSCIPASPVLVGLKGSETDAWRSLLLACGLDPTTSIETFTTVREVENFTDGTDSIPDQPVSFGDGQSSGTDARRFSTRRIHRKQGVRNSKLGED